MKKLLIKVIFVVVISAIILLCTNIFPDFRSYGAPICDAQPPCTPVCPGGTITSNTGGSRTTANCTYQNGDITPGNECALNTVYLDCWSVIAPPVVTVSLPGNATKLGCVASADTIGTVSNNSAQYSVKYTDYDNSNPLVALMLWFSPINPPTISIVESGGTVKTSSNDSYGLMVTKSSGTWSDVYVPGVSGNNSAWIKVGTLSNLQDANILGVDGKKMVGIKALTISVNGSEITLNTTLEYFNEASGIQNFEKSIDESFKIWTSQNTYDYFVQSGGNQIYVNSIWLDTTKSITVDLTKPVSDSFSYAVKDQNIFSLTWRAGDAFSGIKRVVADAYIDHASEVSDTIDDLTSGVSNYTIKANINEDQNYGGAHLWSTGSSNRVDDINIKNNQGGSMIFKSTFFDNGCNDNSAQLLVPFGQTWIATKAGVVFSDGGLSFNIPNLTGHTKLSNDTYWDSPTVLYKDEVDFSSEIFVSPAASLTSLVHSATLGSGVKTSADANEKTNYWANELVHGITLKKTQDPANFSVIETTSPLVLTGNLSGFVLGADRCVNGKLCYIHSTNDIQISNFVCDRRALIVSDKSISIVPDVRNSGTTQGCIYISRDDVTIYGGSYKSAGSTYPKYDLIDGFIIAEDQIRLSTADSTRNVRDGIKVTGGLIAIGTVSQNAFYIPRSLRLIDGTSFPLLVVHADPRYMSIATSLLGGSNDTFKSEVGYKPL